MRDLAAEQSGYVLRAEGRQLADESYHKSISQIQRLFQHISHNPPHTVKSIISVVRGRRQIVDLDRPLMEITNIIQKNIENIQHMNLKLHFLEQQGLVLEEGEDRQSAMMRLTCPSNIILLVQSLEKSLTVCKNDRCSKIVTRGTFTETLYRLWAHPTKDLAAQAVCDRKLYQVLLFVYLSWYN